MGTMTLANIRDEVKLRLQNRSDTGVSDARILQWVNMAYNHMTHPSIHEFEQLSVKNTIALVADTREYALTTATLGHEMIAIRTIHFINATSETLTDRRHRLRPRDIRQLDNKQPTSSEPRYYYLNEGQNLIVDPYPGTAEAGKVLLIRYWREVAPFAQDANVSVLPNYYDEVLVLGALYRAEEVLEYRDRAEETRQNYVNLLNDASEKPEVEADDWDHKTEVRRQPEMSYT
jgi:hypothetical protein